MTKTQIINSKDFKKWKRYVIPKDCYCPLETLKTTLKQNNYE